VSFISDGRSAVNLVFDNQTLRDLVRPIAEEIAQALVERDADPTIALPEVKAATRLGMTSTQLRDRRLAGEIVGTRLGNRWFYQLCELHDYARRNRAD
jgi:hypothetical protein